jgi:hypothetical protein
MNSVTVGITVKSHPSKEGTIKVITMYTSQVLSDIESNDVDCCLL